MNMRDLIPWSRQSSTAPVPYKDDGSNSIFGLPREVDRLFDELFRGSLPSLGSGFAHGRTFGTWPTIELSETGHEVRITAEIPGMSEKDVEVLVEEGTLTLRGERKSETEDEDRGYSERYYGRFERRIALPPTVSEEGGKATFSEGVLTVTLPKSADAERGRRIPINEETQH